MPKTEDLSNVPASVIKQQRDAERKIQDLMDNPTPEPEANEPVGNTEPTIKPEPTVEPTEPVKPVEPMQPAIYDNQSKDFEHKYNVLQGKYNKEVGDLRSELDTLKEMVSRQNKIIEDNSKQPEPTQSKIETTDLDPEDFSGWGDEMAAMVKQVNRLNAIIKDQSVIIDGLKNNGQPGAAEDSHLMDRVKSLESQSQEARVNSYLKQLDTGIKGEWRKLNVDPNFHKWLSETDPMSMAVRGQLLNAAAENLRGDQVVSIFNQYIDGRTSQGKSNVTIADELPGGGGQGDLHGSEPGKTKVTEEACHKAQQDFIKGRITEEEYDKVYADFQKELRRQQRS